jgi:glycosyltransferase involved in cell wall biosynthesis
MTKISVITVCFNSEKTIDRMLKSVAEQDCLKVEHIIIDGGSTDNTNLIIEKYRSNLSYVKSEPDEGIYDAMNKGLYVASGEIVCFLNADDYYSSANVLSAVYDKMQSKQLEALMGDVAFFHENKPTKIVRRYRSDRFRPSRLKFGFMPAHPALFMRKEVYDRVGYFNKNYSIGGDFDFIVRTFHNKKIKYDFLKEVLVLMQTGGASDNGLKAKILLNKEFLRACKEGGVKTNMINILSRYRFKILEKIFYN